MEPFTLAADDGAGVAAYRVLPQGEAKAVVQVAHGMGEHFGRYAHLADALTDAGYGVYATDHRGHGGSAELHGVGDFGPGGFQSVVDDMAALTRLARSEVPGRPLALLGHSMGSFAAQAYVLQHPTALDALVLSGTAALDVLGPYLAESGAGAGLEAFNGAFAPARTPFDWLSRDEAQVDAYIADPLCGFSITDASSASMAMLAGMTRHDPRLAQVPRDLPVYVISGEFDPVVGPGQAFARALVEGLEAAGLRRVEHRVYPGGRHEMFNETNREEVERDLVAWLDSALAPAAAL